jgi:hypothetical protein
MRWMTIVVAVLGLALVGAGCGGDEEAAEDTDTTGITITTGTDETTTDETTTDETTTDDLDDGSGLASGDCRELVDASSALGQAFAAPGSDVDESEAFDELADRVPDEIRDDYEVLADAYRSYADALQDIDIGAGETPSAEALQALQQALASVDQQAVTQATQNISTWVTANCPTG